jgi:hypothetical protein
MRVDRISTARCSSHVSGTEHPVHTIVRSGQGPLPCVSLPAFQGNVEGLQNLLFCRSACGKRVTSFLIRKPPNGFDHLAPWSFRTTTASHLTRRPFTQAMYIFGFESGNGDRKTFSNFNLTKQFRCVCHGVSTTSLSDVSILLVSTSLNHRSGLNVGTLVIFQFCRKVSEIG